MSDNLLTHFTAEHGVKNSDAVVRVSTSYYATRRGIAMTKRVEFLKRKSNTDVMHTIREDVSYVGAECVMKRIINLDDVKDGIYKMTLTNAWRDHETGHIEDWSYKLVPCKENKP